MREPGDQREPRPGRGQLQGAGHGAVGGPGHQHRAGPHHLLTLWSFSNDNDTFGKQLAFIMYLRLDTGSRDNPVVVTF